MSTENQTGKGDERKKSGVFIPRGSQRWWEIVGTILKHLTAQAVEDEKILRKRARRGGAEQIDDEQED